ncbi:hypothetical protein JCM8547_003787 [Rhodosporidiobolus lusitaniae]
MQHNTGWYGFPTTHQLPPQPQQAAPLGYSPHALPTPYAPAQELQYDPTHPSHQLGVPGPSTGGFQDSPCGLDPLGGDLDDDDDSGLGGSQGGTGKKKGGRPRDKVWELFDGNREVAKCRWCGWRTDHPKAFRMRSHVIACQQIPQEEKDDLARVQEEKEQKRASKAELADSLGGPPAASGPAAPKKAKRDHEGNEVVIAPKRPVKPKMAPPAPVKRSPITCHVLDSTSGKPAPEMRIRLDRLNTTGFVLQAQGMTDNDGRCSTLLPAGTQLEIGIFKITFFVSEYFTKRGILSFYPFIEIPFEVKSAEEHYHIPCLLSPYSYTTYRGS